ncbi:caspase family protein [Pseudomarimonas salicorniae]|uniref:Caspase family protein n=1 Tax=Pseudomarimonas salicorniae TaxID=2933270 RepID=A0ABT0GER3_9GAMM|nr:caspase family protein [Lysobacter sp. CAU 1642]MCK7593026.1 caspase family protein [Lysobacter sp. CAU 1642]
MSAAVRTLCALLLAAGCVAAGSAMAERPPQKFAVVIGVDKYKHTDAELSFAVADMKAMKNALEYQGFVVTPLQDADATRERILLELLRLADEVGPQDTLLIYYAGHGVLGPKTGTTYWLNHDGKPEHPDLAGLRVMHLLDYVADIDARYKIVMLDHCFSAGMDEATLARLRDIVRAPEEALPAQPAPNANHGGHKARQIALGERAPMISQRVGGALFIAASRGVAHETVKDGHGLFTAAFLRALRDPAVEDGSPGLISIQELAAFVPRTTRELGRPDFVQDVYFNRNISVGEETVYYPFLRELSGPDEVEREVTLLLAELDTWHASGLLATSAFEHCREVLQRWADFGELVEPIDIETVRAVRELTRQYRADSAPVRAQRLQTILSELVAPS